ncbi:MAG: hypothetical protein H6922_05410 [Pseudomonadaceae bacterium]|nr:hypothetical protein [Pseudomonadaceae bacterium]
MKPNTFFTLLAAVLLLAVAFVGVQRFRPELLERATAAIPAGWQDYVPEMPSLGVSSKPALAAGEPLDNVPTTQVDIVSSEPGTMLPEETVSGQSQIEVLDAPEPGPATVAVPADTTAQRLGITLALLNGAYFNHQPVQALLATAQALATRLDDTMLTAQLAALPPQGLATRADLLSLLPADEAPVAVNETAPWWQQQLGRLVKVRRHGNDTAALRSALSNGDFATAEALTGDNTVLRPLKDALASRRTALATLDELTSTYAATYLMEGETTP